ncbi:putative polysialyltransferase [Brochothrix thermosphacta]|uniref:hypothetical protein n=1 Tax=Brochothrix thermosphacta TaxID=2756 RepID=UPI000D778452|nr:hypothetical protein [Brochothrix thermosphacta]SPN72535.1 putative polysialyltransferase [Brochothrix thermosphacta]
MNRIDAVREIHKLEQETGIHSIKRHGISLYQLVSVAVTMNLITDPGFRTNEGRIGSLKRMYKKRNDIFLEIPENIQYNTEDKSVLFMLRGKYNEMGQDVLIHEYYEYYKENFRGQILCIDRKLEAIAEPNCYGTKTFTNHFKDFSKNFIRENDDIVNFTKEEIEKIRKFENQLLKLGYSGMLFSRLLSMKARDFLVERLNYLIYLKINKVKKIYLSLGYVHVGLLAAAKELNITTVEIQYANISKLHPGFSFVTREVLTADYLIVWGAYFGEQLECNNSQLLYRSPVFLRNQDYKKKEQILVIVQKLEFRHFEKLIKPLAENNEFPIIFRMPLGINLNNTFITQLKKYNVKISEAKDPKSTMEYISESKWVLSGYSTALIESMGQKSVTISYQDIPNSEEFYPYISAGYMHELTSFDMRNYEYTSQKSELFHDLEVEAIINEIEK